MTVEELIQQAMQALHGGDPRKARDHLVAAMEAAGEPRADLHQAMAVVLLQLGEPGRARPLLEQALEMGWKAGAPPEFLVQVQLGVAAASEDMDEPARALKAYDDALELDDGTPRARASRAHLLMACGRIDEALAELATYINEDRDEDTFIEAAGELARAVKAMADGSEGREPRDLLVAHRDSYVEFFDETVKEMEEKGWMSECARMRRAPDGRLVPSIPDGARPYAGVRVDLVDPSTGQAGQVGDQPMVVAVAGLEPLARAVVLFNTGERAFELYISSQCPWDQLPIQVLFESGDAVAQLDPVIGAWYESGFNGRFGTRDGGRVHYISDPQPCRGGKGVVYDVDLGRASFLAIEDLLSRLLDLHHRHPIAQVILGRGHLRDTWVAPPLAGGPEGEV